jgi:hypothetical protein
LKKYHLHGDRRIKWLVMAAAEQRPCTPTDEKSSVVLQRLSAAGDGQRYTPIREVLHCRLKFLVEYRKLWTTELCEVFANR